MSPLHFEFPNCDLKKNQISLSAAFVAQLLFITQIYCARFVCLPPFFLPVNRLTLSLANSLFAIYFQIL